ncbi:MAG: hypothetical protein EOM24_31960, partial [Chloroflexia bacterium]|nr:hypothetical protein [Chloroflexia bacterium]
MPTRLWLPSEIARRTRILRDDIATHVIAVDINEAGQGIHQSQVVTLKTMMEVLLQRQDKLVTDLASDLSPARLAEVYSKLLGEIAGSHGLWRLFRTIFAQRLDPDAKQLLDAADLIADDCYRPCIEQARSWGLIKGEFREPPLVWI